MFGEERKKNTRTIEYFGFLLYPDIHLVVSIFFFILMLFNIGKKGSRQRIAYRKKLVECTI